MRTMVTKAMCSNVVRTIYLGCRLVVYCAALPIHLQKHWARSRSSPKGALRLETADNQLRLRHSVERGPNGSRRCLQALVPGNDNQHRRAGAAQGRSQNAVA